jgi:hypothetical protein
MTKTAGSGSESGSGSISQRHGSADTDTDPDPPQNDMDPATLVATFPGPLLSHYRLPLTSVADPEPEQDPKRILKVTDENSRIRSRSQTRIQRYGFVQKCHGSAHYL